MYGEPLAIASAAHYGRRMETDEAYLVVLGDREPIAWVLAGRRMAFSAHRADSVRALPVGTRLFLYATRGAFRNPNRDRGRVIGQATTTSPVVSFDEPVRFGDVAFTVGCDLVLDSVAPLHSGPELQPLVPRLHAFPKPAAWSVYLRRPLVPLDRHDVDLLTAALKGVARDPAKEIAHYLSEAQPKGRK